jgi:hypothetical protein
MNKRLFIILPLLLAVVVMGCNKESSYTLKLKNVTAQNVRVRVDYDPTLAAPGQNTLKFDKIVYAGQYVEIYYNKGLGIDLPLMKDNDTLLQYVVKVWDEDSVPSSRNFRSLNNYVQKGNEKKKEFIYEGQIFDLDFL